MNDCGLLIIEPGALGGEVDNELPGAVEAGMVP